MTRSDGTLTADSEAAGYEVENLQDWQPFTYWKPATTGDHNAKIAFASNREANYFAFYSQDLYLHAGTIQLESSDDNSTWTNRSGTITPTSNAPVYKSFPQTFARYWRVRTNCATACAVGVVAFGVDLQLEYGAWIGFSPPIFARNNVVTNQTSEKSVFLARSLDQNGSKLILPLDFHRELWVRQYWLPFMDHADLKPFFYQWNPLDNPTEIAFCRTDKPLGRPTFSHADLMKFELSADALLN
jgi:hypothetical protein